MCIICVSPKRVRQPNVTTIRRMFQNNPDGAGYMVARDGKVIISKGFMNVDEYIEAIRAEHFTAKDPVVYHFRISTQAGVNPQMTHPFPLSNRIEHMKVLDVECSCGVAHNGIIRLTTDRNNREYSDTALFIANYLSLIIREPGDLKDERVLTLIHRLAGSKLAIMDGDGYIATVGEYINQKGLLFSNTSFETDTYYRRFR
jgi:predicted glutamine amidotransferase